MILQVFVNETLSNSYNYFTFNLRTIVPLLSFYSHSFSLKPDLLSLCTQSLIFSNC